jgi:hypothetical protein
LSRGRELHAVLLRVGKGAELAQQDHAGIEVEMLFVSGAGFRIVFQDFSFSHAPR